MLLVVVVVVVLLFISPFVYTFFTFFLSPFIFHLLSYKQERQQKKIPLPRGRRNQRHTADKTKKKKTENK
jgi:phosphate/sulfate permease